MRDVIFFTFNEQLFVVVVTGRMPRRLRRRRITTAKVQPPGQRPAAVVIAAATKLVVVFQTLDRVAFNLALHDRPVWRMTDGTRTECTTAARRRSRQDDCATPPLHATADCCTPPAAVEYFMYVRLLFKLVNDETRKTAYERDDDVDVSEELGHNRKKTECR